jgi:hypothetical protein
VKVLNCLVAATGSLEAACLIKYAISGHDRLSKSHCEVPEAPCLSRVAGLLLIRLRSVPKRSDILWL